MEFWAKWVLFEWKKCLSASTEVCTPSVLSSIFTYISSFATLHSTHSSLRRLWLPRKTYKAAPPVEIQQLVTRFASYCWSQIYEVQKIRTQLRMPFTRPLDTDHLCPRCVLAVITARRAPVVDEFIVQRISRQSFHDVALGWLVGERDGRHHVSAEVDAEDRDGAERQWNVGDDEQQERRDLRDVARQRVGDRLLEVVKDQSTLRHNRKHRWHYYHYWPLWTLHLH